MDDILFTAAKAYKELTRKRHIITFSNGETITLVFRPQNFKHLAGINKLDDLAEISHSPNPADLYKRILHGDLTIYDIQRSKKYTTEAQDRIELITHIKHMISKGRAVFGFDSSKLKFATQIGVSVIFFEEYPYSFFLVFGVAEGRNGKIYYPKTFFMRNNDDYIRNQNIVDITDYKQI